MESRKNGERTAEVLRLKRERGEKTGGAVPFGYNVAVRGGTKVLVPNENEQRALKLFRKYRALGWSIRKIAEQLERRGVKTKTGKKKWSLSTVHKLLNVDWCDRFGTKKNSKQGKKSKKKARKA